MGANKVEINPELAHLGYPGHVAHVSAALAQAGLRPGSVLGSGPPFPPHSTEIGPQYGSVRVALVW